MRELKLAIVCLIAGFSFAFVNPDYMEWTPNKKLSFTDFKANVPKGKSAHVVNLTTVVTYQSRQEAGKPPKMTILNYIDRNASWIKVKKPEILALEQIKFDYSELNARKIRKEMAKMNKQGVKEKQKYIDVITKMVNQFEKRRNRGVLLEDQPHLIKIMQKDVQDSLILYKEFAK